MRSARMSRLVGLVEVFKGVLLHARLDLRAQLVRELALLLNGLQDRRAAVLQFGVVAQALLDLRDLHLVEVAVDLLAVAGDERNRVPLAQQLRDGGDLPAGNPQFGRKARQHLLRSQVVRHVFRSSLRRFLGENPFPPGLRTGRECLVYHFRRTPTSAPRTATPSSEIITQ